MSSALIQWVSLLFSKVVQMYTSIKFPGTNFSIFTIVFFAAFGSVVITILRKMFDLPSGIDRAIGGNSRSIKISKDRRGDER